QSYRRYALTALTPSTERNTNQRLLQALQGKLITEMDQRKLPLSFFLTSEEIKSLKTMAADLLTLTTREASSEKRTLTLLDLAELKSVLGRLYGQKSFVQIQIEDDAICDGIWTCYPD